MNWEAVGTIAEIISAAGVIASLLYLAVQIRQSTKVARAETTKDLYLASRDAILQIASNDGLARIWTSIRNFESEDIAQSYTLIIRMFAQTEFFSEYWSKARRECNEKFVVYVDRQIEVAATDSWLNAGYDITNDRYWPNQEQMVFDKSLEHAR